MLETRNVPRQASSSTAITPPPHARARTHTHIYIHTHTHRLEGCGRTEQCYINLPPLFCSAFSSLLSSSCWLFFLDRFIPSFIFSLFPFSLCWTALSSCLFSPHVPFSKIINEQIPSLERIKGEASSTVVRNPLLYKV